MKLRELFTGKENIVNTSGSAQSKYQRAAEISRQIKSLVPGQTIQGEIVGRNGSEVQVRLAEDLLLNARVDQNIHLDLGKLLTFEVRNNGAALTLSPLFTNVAADVNVLKALEMAGLPVNETSVAMTEQMMQAGLPVNKTVLQQVYRELNTYSQAEIPDIIQLHKLQLPVNEANIEQMSNYRNLNYRLGNAMNSLTETIPQTMETLLKGENADTAVQVYREFLFMAVDEGLGESVQSPAQAVVTGEEPAQEPLLQTAANTETQQSPVNEMLTAVTGENHTGILQLAEHITGITEELELPAEAKQTLIQQLQEIAGDTGDIRKLFGVTEKLLEAARSTGQESKVLTELVQNREFSQQLSERIKELWSIQPKDMEKPEKIQELYRRIEHQMNRLTEILESGGHTESPMFKAATNLSQNLDFMQQINQMYAYVQLPLKFQEGKAHGDLYVYTNKRNLAASDGAVSALLHLDMEHLGPVDIYVTLQHSKVNTKFTVGDDEMLDFLEAHMDLLTERLKRRGYDCDFSMTVAERESEETADKGLQPMMQQEQGVLLSHYSFDVRT